MEETLNEALEEENGVRAEAPAQETTAPVTKTEEAPKEEEKFSSEYYNNPVSNLMEHGAVVVKDFIDNTFQGDQRTKTEIGEDEQLKRDKAKASAEAYQKYLDENPNIASETARALVGGVATSIENIGEGAEFLGDTAKSLIGATGLIDVEAKDIPWNESYEAAHWDLGTAKNQTVAGNFAREGLGILINIRQLGALGIGNVGAGNTVASRLATEATRGMIVDFLIDPGEGNLSNMVQDSKYANLFSQALAHEEDDNQYIRRLKNMAEGGVMGLAVDGIGELYGALRAGKNAVKAGAKPEEAAEVVIKRASANMNPEISNKAPNEGGFQDVKQFAVDELDIATEGKVDLRTPAKEEGRVFSIQGDLGENAPGRADWNFWRNKKGNIEMSWDVSLVKGRLPLGRMKTHFKQMVSEGKIRIGETLENHPLSDSFHQSEKDARYISEWRAKKKELRQALVENPDDSLYLRAEEMYMRMYKEIEAEGGDPPVEWNMLDEGDPAIEYYLKAAANLDPRSSPGPVPNKRARIYEKMGFGPLIDGDVQYARVVDDPEKGIILKPVDANGNIIEANKVENDLNSAKTGQEGTFEPQERAAVSHTVDVEDAAVTQALDDGTKGAHRHFDDTDWQDLNTVEDLTEFIKEKADWIDIDDIVRRLGDQGVNYKTNVVRNLAKYASDGALESLDDLRFTNTQGINGVDAGGAVALDVMVNDAAMQIVDLADNLMEVADIDGDFTKQASMILERSESLMKLKKEATIFSSYNLQNWKDMPLELTNATKEADAAITKHFKKMKAAFASGNPEDVLKIREEFKQFAYGLRMTNGDPTKIASFWKTWYKFGFQNLNKAIIQSWLSSPLTQVRNLAGNAFVAIERPLAVAVDGVLSGNRKQAARAFSMFDSFGQTLSESFMVARESLGAEQSITGGMKFHDFASNTQKDVDSLVKTASTAPEKYAANSLKWFHDISNHPWVSWPGKGLQGGDDFFKSLVARMDLRYQAAIEADMVVGQAGKDVKKGLKEEAYKELLNQKIGPNGQILDDELLRSAKEATFQRELSGKMKKIADSINDHPEIKTFIPFVKTPHNINVYAVQHIPGLARFTEEYTQAMKTGTDLEKAIYRGREALGFGLISMAAMGAANDGITGNGPADAELRKIWRRTHEPMSIRIPGTNKWISYKSLPGAEMVMSAVADTVRIADMLPEGEADKLLAQLGYTIANAATNRSYFKGFTDLSIIFDTQNYGKNIANILGDRVNAAIPLGGARQQLENALKPGMEEYRNTLHMMTSKLTGGLLGETVPVIDILTGEQMVTGYEGKLNSLNPFRVSTKSASPLVHVLADLEYELPDVMVTTHKGLSLTTEEQQFIRKEMYAGGEFPKALTRYLKTPRFKKLYDEWEANKGTAFHEPRKNSVWYGEISRIVNKYKIEATRELAKSNPQFKERLNQHKIASKGIKPTLSGAAQRVEDSLNELAEFSQ